MSRGFRAFYRDYVYLSREDPIEKLKLTNRSFNALTRADIRTIGEVIQFLESNCLSTVQGLGRKSLSELTDSLTRVKILDALGTQNPEGKSTIPVKVVRWQAQLVSKHISIGLLYEQAKITGVPVESWFSVIQSIDSNQAYEVLAAVLGFSQSVCEEIEFLLNQIPGQHCMTILLPMYGFQRKTLKQTGQEIGLLRERVRQIRDDLEDRFSIAVRSIVMVRSISDLGDRPTLFRMQSVLLIAKDRGLDITYEQWKQKIWLSRLIGNWTSHNFLATDPVEAMIAICHLLAKST